MTIAPLEPDAILGIVEESVNEMSKCEVGVKSYKKRSESEQTELQQLAWFFSFYICEALSDKVTPEVNGLIKAVRSISERPDLKLLDQDQLSEALINLRYLKGGGLIPGSRIATKDINKHIYAGSGVMCRNAPGQRFMVRSWAPDFSAIEITNGTISGKFPLSELIFVDTHEEKPDQE